MCFSLNVKNREYSFVCHSIEVEFSEPSYQMKAMRINI